MSTPETLVKYWAYGAMLCDDMRYQADHPAVYLAADVDAILRQREEENNLLKHQRDEDVQRMERSTEVIVDLRAQLTAMTAERDEAVRLSRCAVKDALLLLAGMNAGKYPDSELECIGHILQGAYDAGKGALQHQIDAANARVKQLEAKLRAVTDLPCP